MRERNKSTKESLAGALLLAHPSLRDPNFRRAVVLMSAHSPEGAARAMRGHLQASRALVQEAF